jgi:hypothetical protein
MKSLELKFRRDRNVDQAWDIHKIRNFAEDLSLNLENSNGQRRRHWGAQLKGSLQAVCACAR